MYTVYNVTVVIFKELQNSLNLAAGFAFHWSKSTKAMNSTTPILIRRIISLGVTLIINGIILNITVTKTNDKKRSYGRFIFLVECTVEFPITFNPSTLLHQTFFHY